MSRVKLQKRLSEIRVWLEEKTADRPFGCLILHCGEVAAAWYDGGFDEGSIFEIGSIRKSFNSAIVGQALQRGEIALDLRAGDVWPEIVEISGNPADGNLTLHQLMSGTSGWLVGDPPGSCFRYNNAAFTAAERVAARALRFPRDEIAAEVERRFKIPLGTTSWRLCHWARPFTPNDIENAGPKLAIDSTLKDLATWGQLWLDKGLWRGQRLIPKSWVDRATQCANPGIPGPPYGYNWFTNAGWALWPGAPEDSYGHAGFGTFKPTEVPSRAYLWVCPSLSIVAAVVSDVTTGFGTDFLSVPNTITAAWISRITEVFQ